MSTKICSYEGCMVRRVPFSSIAFFAIPTDSRRHQWIANSGNKDLKKLDGTRTRLFCEKHFHERDICSQFHRKTLRKTAVPIPYKQMSPKETGQPLNDQHAGSAEDSLGNNKLEENNVLTYIYNVVACEFEINANEDLEEKLSDEILSYYEPQDGEDEELMENIKYKSSKEQLTLDDANFATSLPIKEKYHETEAIVTTTTRIMQDTDKELTEDVQLSTEDISSIDQEDQTSDSTYDEDKHFALSLVGYFQRLNHEKKAIAKLKILSYLTALDLDKNADL